MAALFSVKKSNLSTSPGPSMITDAWLRAPGGSCKLGPATISPVAWFKVYRRNGRSLAGTGGSNSGRFGMVTFRSRPDK